MTGATDTTWFEFATAIMESAARRGAPHARINAITTADYPTPVRRPADSRLDCQLIARTYGVRLPAWQDSLETCLERLLTTA